MQRITSTMLYNNNISNIFKTNREMLRAQSEIASGKRINRPSDDSIGASQTLNITTTLSTNLKYLDNIVEGEAFLNLADSALNEIGNLLNRAREIAISQGSALANDSSRDTYAGEVDSILNQIIQLGNTSKGGKYIFAGASFSTQPFTSGAVYLGSRDEAFVEVLDDSLIGIGLDGSKLLGTDLNPAVDSSTPISALYRGGGATLGSISITDRAGNSATIDLSAASTLGDVVNAISNASGINVTASFNTAANGLLITDDNSVPISNLTVAESGGGSTASALGILADRSNGILVGRDLNPAVTASTSLSLLNMGDGLSLSSFSVHNGAASGTVTLASASTVGDIINAINGLSGLNVTASLNSTGTAIEVTSNSSSTVAYVLDTGSGTTGADLGITGGNNILKSLFVLRDALRNNDGAAIRGASELMDTGLDAILAERGKVGARANRLEVSKGMLTIFNDENEAIKSSVEDADIVKAASDLARFQTAYQATLQATARILQTTLLDFIR